MNEISKAKKNVALSFKDFHAEFLKRAEGDVHFVCTQMMEIKNAGDLFPLLDIHASPYWDNHYRFGEISDDVSVKYLGKDAIHNILINTVAPMQYLYAKLQGKSSLIENSIQLLQSIKPEKNKVLNEWNEIGIKAKDASQSQALLQLFNQYCSAKKCLECSIGNRLIRKG